MRGESVLLVVLFPCQGTFHRFLPAAVAVVALGGFDAWTEFAFDHRFFLKLVKVLPEANRQTCQIRRAQRRYFSHLRTFNAGTQNVGLELHQEVIGYRTAVHAQGVQTNAGVRLHRFQHVARLVGDGFQGRTNNVV